ncbi:hypothetical protein ACIQUQ_14075 [Streptomyces sp. NPDC101118]|uniref:hypothetical protein n=1 Tax=Streptomyces sp. NPDC101118 TaxID=3366109 RepID=UPI00380A4932
MTRLPLSSPASLSGQLLRMGRAARRSADGRLRTVALLTAAAVVALGLSAVAAVCAAYDGMEQRTASRSIQFRSAFPDRPATALARNDFDEAEGRQYSLVYVRPLAPGVPPPPGVDRWPAPGEAVLSAALARALRDEGAPERLGRVVGTIHPAGLASPGERYAYVNPTDRQLDGADFGEVTGFGGERGLPMGDLLFVSDRGKLLTGLYLVLLPAATLAVVAVRMGSAARDRRTALVGALGGGPSRRLLMHLGESGPPVLLGACLGTLPAWAAMPLDEVRLPWIGYHLSTTDLRHWWWAIVLAGAGSAAGLVLLVAVMHRAGGRTAARSPRWAAHRGHALRWAAYACPVLLLATVRGPALLDPAEHADLRMLLYNAGVVAVLATLPCAVALGASALGPRLADSARRRGGSGALLAGRHIAAHPAQVARLVAGMGIAMVLVSQMQLKHAQFGESAQAAQATAQRVGRTVLLLQADPGRLPPGRLEGFLRQLPSPVRTLALRSEEGSDPARRVVVRGDCQALGGVRLPCAAKGTARGAARTPGTTVPLTGADPRVVEAVRWSVGGSDRVAVEQGGALTPNWREAPPTLVLTTSDGADLPVDRLKRQLRDTLPLAAVTAELPGESWLVGSRNSEAHSRWVTFFGLPGTLVVALAIVFANLAEFLRLSGLVAPLSVLTGSRKVHYTTAAWALLAPLLLTVVVSAVVAWWLAAPQESAVDGIAVSGGLLAATAVSLSGLAVLAWWCGARAAVGQSARWRPYGDGD